MYCTKCGNQLTGNEKFCPKCGFVATNNNSAKESRGTSTGESFNNPASGGDLLADLNNNIVFKELLNPSGRRNRKKYIIVFLVAFLIFYFAGSFISWRGSEIKNTIAGIIRCLMVYICFVNLSKRLHDFDRTAGWAIPIFVFSYFFYYVLPPYIFRDMLFAYSHEVRLLKILMHICMVLTVLPHILLYFVKGTEGVNQYGGEEKQF